MRNFRTCFRAMLATARTVRWKIFVSALIGIAEVAASLTFVWLSKTVVDIATGQVSGSLGSNAAALVAVLVLQVALRTAARYYEGYVVVNACNSIRAATFEKVMRSTWSGKEKLHSGDTVNRLEEDIRVTTEFVCVDLPQIIVTVLQLVCATAFLFVLQADLALILLFIMPVAVVGSRLYFKKMRSLTMEIRRGDSAVQSHLQESIQHRTLVRTMGATGNVLSDLDDLQDEVRQKTMSRLGYAAVSRTFLQLGFGAGYVLAFLWGVYGLKNGSVTYGLMTAFLQLVSQVQRPVADISRHIPLFIRALSSEDRILELSSMEQEKEGRDIFLPGAPGVRLDNVGFSYSDGEKDVLRKVDFDFRPGSFTVILGPTGAGKSTLIRIILSLLKPGSGSVRIYTPDGEEAVVSVDTRCNFMYVPQGNSLLSGTIRDNLLLADPSATEERMREVLETAQASFVFSLPDALDTKCAETGSGLSEGQAQRISIARALLRPGGVLILDEATSALDSDTEEALLKSLNEKYRGNKTIICVTHRSAAASFADSVLEI